VLTKARTQERILFFQLEMNRFINWAIKQKLHQLLTINQFEVYMESPVSITLFLTFQKPPPI